MKNYENPSIEIVEIEEVSTITTSSGSFGTDEQGQVIYDPFEGDGK